MSGTAPVLVASMTGTEAHDTGPGHPERPTRLAAVERGLRAKALEAVTAPLIGRLASRELLRVHSAEYLTALERLAAAGGGQLDPDMPMTGGPGRPRWLLQASVLSRSACSAGVGAGDSPHHARHVGAPPTSPYRGQPEDGT
jgi:acetoin utilization deacetylase AcuC-like enzyme